MSGGKDEAPREALALLRRMDAKLDQALALLTRMTAPPSKTDPGG